MKKSNVLQTLGILTLLNDVYKLSRLHSLYGALLLLIPSWWGLFAGSLHQNSSFPTFKMGLFMIGALCIRSAGCVYNDLVDRNLDKFVQRTKDRPLARKDSPLPPSIAIITLLLWLLAASSILLLLPIKVFYVSLMACVLILVYPWMKRITYYPQLFLGVTFASAFSIGWFAVNAPINKYLVSGFLGVTIWVFIFDTIYGLQDISDDKKIGVKSSAIGLGPFLRSVLILLLITQMMLFIQLSPIMKSPHIYFFFLTIWVGWLIKVALALKQASAKKCGRFFQQQVWGAAFFTLGFALQFI